MNSWHNTIFLPIAVLAVVDAATASRGHHELVDKVRSSSLHPLHHLLSIGEDDPSQFIHPNVLINMEGL